MDYAAAVIFACVAIVALECNLRLALVLAVIAFSLSMAYFRG